MFSHWLGLLKQKNLIVDGDRNPGAFNLWQLVGYKYGLVGVILDFSKGYIPVALFLHMGLAEQHSYVLIALAPIIGHAFSPFLSFKGGKAIAVSFGVWSALTAFEVSVVYALILAVLLAIAYILRHRQFLTTEANAVQVILGMVLLVLYIYQKSFPSELYWFWFGNLLLLIHTHKRELLYYIQRNEAQ